MDENAFLEAILAALDDDGPRLIYADWLEEKGNPRGEFIRLQCKEKKTNEEKDRVIELQKAHEKQWVAEEAGEYYEGTGHQYIHYVFRRGFLSSVVVQIVMLEAMRVLVRDSRRVYREINNYLDRIVQSCFVQSVYLATSGQVVHFSYKWLRHVRNLQIRNAELSDAQLRLLLESPYIGEVTHLGLVNNALEDPGVESLADSLLFGRLITLNLRRNRVGLRGVQALLFSPHSGKIKQLDLRDNPLDEECIRGIAQAVGVNDTGLLEYIILQLKRKGILVSLPPL